MASEIRVNTINSRTGFGTITVSETGQDLVGITTIENLTTENTLVGAAASFTGNVQIGGVLTYEDVTNIDAVGLITARSGIEIGARPGVGASISADGNMIVSGISTFGGDVNITGDIKHVGDTNTSIKFPSNDTITLETGGTEHLRIDADGRLLQNITAVGDYMHQMQGAGGTGRIPAVLFKNGTASTNEIIGGWTAYNTTNQVASIYAKEESANDDAYLQFSTGATGGSLTERLRITSGGKVSIGGPSNTPPSTPDGNLHIQDGSAGSVTADTAGNIAVFEDSASNGISILVPAAERANIYFGTPGTGGQIEAGIQYAHESVSTVADRRDMIFRVGGGEKVRFQGTGGISFNGDSAAENALDDYEEGTFTLAATSDATMTSSNGTYTKIGRVVCVKFHFQINQINSGSTTHLTGLPFSAAEQGYGSSGYFAGLGNFNSISPYATGVTVYFNVINTNNVFAQNPAILANGGRLDGSIVYTTS